ncbi:Protein AHNAK2 [Trichinella spiralis]|uniref:Protein AHNAK2 n=1 Tax=Trichinella spiralis TaxID=6334 RepID=A0ABR3KXU6_TRISP
MIYLYLSICAFAVCLKRGGIKLTDRKWPMTSGRMVNRSVAAFGKEQCSADELQALKLPAGQSDQLTAAWRHCQPLTANLQSLAGGVLP